MAEKRIFNLLKPVEAPTTAWDKVYDWMIGKARIIVFVTELIIAASFIAKVVVDTNAKNKDSQITTLSGQLQLYAPTLEPQFRTIQTKSSDYMNLWKNSSSYSAVINEVFSYIQNQSAELSMSIDKNN